jgi:hypothetical protein
METSFKDHKITLGYGMLAFAIFISFIVGLVLGFRANHFFEMVVADNDWRGIATRRAKMFFDDHGIYGRSLIIGMNGGFELDLSGSEISDLTLLYGMPLKALNISDTPVTDLSPLMHMHGLNKLDISGTYVSDLAPLAELPLTSLNLSLTPVSDLEPLANTPIQNLRVFTASITDLTPLQNMQLKDVYFMETNALLDKSVHVLREMPSIRTINFYSNPEQFWKEYDQKKRLRVLANEDQP